MEGCPFRTHFQPLDIKSLQETGERVGPIYCRHQGGCMMQNQAPSDVCTEYDLGDDVTVKMIDQRGLCQIAAQARAEQN